MPFTDDIKNFATKPGNIGRYGGAALGALLAPAIAHLISSRKGRRLGGLQALLLALGGGTAGYFGGGHLGDKLQGSPKTPAGDMTTEDPAVAASRDQLIEAEVADKLRTGSKQVTGDADVSDEQKERVERVQANQPEPAKPEEGKKVPKAPTAAERKASDEKARKLRENYTKISQENDEAREEAARFM